jgi:hypothetical protein
MELRQLSFATLLRLIARATSAISVGALLLFVVGGDEGFRPTGQELVGLLFFPAGVAIGLALAWWREGLGASVALASLAAFYVVYGVLLSDRFPNGPWFLIFTSPAALFLASWAIRRSSERGAPIEAR